MPSARTALLKKAAAEISREIQRAQRPRVDAKFMPDEFQRQVIASTSRLLRVLAPAGSGKTATIVEKALRIVEADRRASVLMLTFTNAGVNAFNAEVQRRAPTLQTRCRATTLNKFGLHAIKSASPDVRSFPHDKPFVAFKTVQGLNNGPRGVPTPDGRFPFTDLWAALEVTKQLGVSPFDGDDEEDQATLEYLDELGPLKVLYAHLEHAEVSISPDPESIREFWLPFWREVVEQTRRFGLTMEDQKFRAFWDQERSPALRKHIGAKGITHLLVDEFQDTNFLELQLIASIARENRSALYIVGDDDQCIYEWKGCTPVFMTSPDTILPGLLGVEDTFDTVVLERNYRCPRNIVDISRRLIEHNINRVEKEIVAASSDVAHIRHVRLPTSAISVLTLVLLLQQVTQADPKHRFALLARKKAQLVPLQVLLSKHGLDYYIPADCNIFTQDSFGALLDAFELRGAFRSTSGPQLGASRSKDLLRGLADRVWKKALYGPDEGTFNRALYGVTSVHDGLLAIDRAGYLDGKKRFIRNLSLDQGVCGSRHMRRGSAGVVYGFCRVPAGLRTTQRRHLPSRPAAELARRLGDELRC